MSNSRFKYKVWDKQEKKFLVRARKFDFHLMPDGFLEVSSGYDSYKDPTFEDDTDQDRYIVLWFTGVKDKNEVEIYERDIVDDQFDCGQLKLIKYDENKACFVDEWIGGCGFSKTYESPVSVSPETITKGVIIGNSYENPELLNR